MEAVTRPGNLGSGIRLGLAVCALLFGSPAARGERCSCAPCDFDFDGDVDQADFGHLQACMSGEGIEQTDPNCLDANLDGDGDGDVDQYDVAVFEVCLWGAGVPLDNGDVSELLINEFMASNDSILADEDNDYPDWIEIHNPGTCRENINLEGWHLTDDPENLTRWQFPSVDLGSGEYLIVFASGKDRAVPGSELHTNFQIDADGEYLALVYPDGRHIVHEYAPEYPNQHTDVSYGLYAGEEHYFWTPTPGLANNDLFAYFVADTKFSVDRGFYDAPFQVEITTETVGATIRYALNGTEPTETTGTVYTGPIAINSTTCLRAAAFKTDWVPTNVDTQTYIFLADVLNQPTSPPGFPATWGGGSTGCANPSMTGDYEVDPDVVEDPVYIDRLNDALTSIPSLSIVMNLDDLFDPDTGIYSNSKCEGLAWERAASTELIFPDGTEGFQENAGIRIQGGSSTQNWKSIKLSMRLLFKEEYGPTKLRYKLFPDSAIDSINTLVLDARLNLSWIHPSDAYQREHAQYLRDQYVADLHNAMGHLSPHGVRAHVYINGLYWGMYCLHERPDDALAAEYLGGNREDYDILRHNSNDVVAGSNDSYKNELLAAAAEDMTDDAKYQAVVDMLDINNFIDYLILNFYVGNSDWDGQNWYASFNRVDPDGRWRYHSWDAEHVLKDVNYYRLDKNDTDSATGIHHKLTQNPEYCMLFADRVHKLMFNDGVLTPQKAAELYNQHADEIDTAVIMESARWGDARRPDDPYTRDDEWLTELNRLLNDYFPQRTAIVVGQFRDHSPGLYPSVDAPVFNQHGGSVPSGFHLTMTNPNGSGTVYYTLDGSDPRLHGGARSPGAIEYIGPITLTANTIVKARVLDGQWSALNEPTFVAGRMVLINEFMADNQTTIEDPESPGAYPDWLELYNADTVTVDLGGMYLTDDLNDSTKWQIPLGLSLDPGGYLLFWADNDDEQGDTHTNFRLDNNGEEIGLFDTDGTTGLDSIVFGPQYGDVSYGRYPDGTDNWGFMATPSPGTPNNPHSGP